MTLPPTTTPLPAAEAGVPEQSAVLLGLLMLRGPLVVTKPGRIG